MPYFHPSGRSQFRIDPSRRLTRIVILIASVALTLAACNHNDVPLGKIDLRKHGLSDGNGIALELERTANTSKVRIIPERSSPLGESMFVAMALFEIAQARHFEYFVSLQESNEPDGSWVYIAGFTNKKEADVKEEFGSRERYRNESGHERQFFSVSEMKRLMEIQQRNLKRTAATNGAHARP